MTLTCPRCGDVPETDPAIVARIEHRLAALAVGNAPLAPVAVCPTCNAEATVAPFWFQRDGAEHICAWHPGFDRTHPANKGASHGICADCAGRL
jgi:hypothetical protein